MTKNGFNGSTVRRIESLIEIILLAVIFYLVWVYMIYDQEYFFPYLGRGKYILMGIYAFISILFIHFCDGFRFGYLKMADIVFSQWIALFLTNVITYFQMSLMANVMISVKPFLWLTLIDFFTAILCIYIFNLIYNATSNPRNLIMVYGNKESVSLKLKMDTRSDRYNITRLIPADAGIDAIEEAAMGFDGLVICDVESKLRNQILKFCYEKSIRTYVTPKISDVIMRGADDILLFDTPLVMIKTTGLSAEQRFVKRVLDIVLCSIAAIVLSPFMLIVAIAIKAEDGGPVFYKQTRVTIFGQKFDILKFRSMIVDAEKQGVKPATDHDDRITKVGRVIRATRMDELPQLFNIIKGDMSIVGPRPERVEHVEKYTDMIPEFAFRSKVKGGLTGYAQIYGKYNTTAYDKIKLDLMYIENYSIMLDVKLVLMTIRILFKKESTEGFDKVITVDEIIENTRGLE